MFPDVKKVRAGWVSTCLTLAFSLLALPAMAANALNVCAGKAELPFSNDKQEGFENKIASVIGKALNMPVNYFWWTNPLTLQKDMEAGKCDVLIGTDPNDPRVLTTADRKSVV